MDVDRVAHRVGSLLGLRLQAAAPATIELVGPVGAETRDRLAAWLDHQDSTT